MLPNKVIIFLKERKKWGKYYKREAELNELSINSRIINVNLNYKLNK